jgi:hypothetical protein
LGDFFTLFLHSIFYTELARLISTLELDFVNCAVG